MLIKIKIYNPQYKEKVLILVYFANIVQPVVSEHGKATVGAATETHQKEIDIRQTYIVFKEDRGRNFNGNNFRAKMSKIKNVNDNNANNPKRSLSHFFNTIQIDLSRIDNNKINNNTQLNYDN